MCGRFSITLPAEAMARLLDCPETLSGLFPRYNVTPGSDIPVLGLNREGKRSLRALHWGFPAISGRVTMSGETGLHRKPLINARLETVQEKPAFRDSFARRRCLVPATGFFEWSQGKKGKRQAWLIRPSSGLFAAGTEKAAGEDGTVPLFLMAAIFSPLAAPHPARRHGPLASSPSQDKAEPAFAVALLTRAASQDMAPVHHRMPVILPADQVTGWLEASTLPRDAWRLAADKAATGFYLCPVDLTARPSRSGISAGETEENGTTAGGTRTDQLCFF